ncbi:MAG: hypothetical protein P1V97_39165, partial [Planctomycetota bacterium]|nr:hypothetical protein [Planctomycetota bacterium]
MTLAQFDPKQWDKVIKQHPPFTWLYRSLCLLLLLFAVFLRTPGFNRSLWYDELFSVVHFMSGSFFDSLWTYRAANNHPLYSFMANLSARFFSGDAAFRYPALLFGLVGVFLPLYMGPKLGFSRFTSFVAALFLTIAPGHVLYSIEARAYSASALSAGLIMILPALNLKSRGQLCAFTGAIVFALWVHPANALISIGVSLSLLIQTLTRTKRLAPNNSGAKSFLIASIIGHALVFLIYLKILKRLVSFARRNVLQDLSLSPHSYFTGLLSSLSSWDRIAEISGLLLAFTCLGLFRAMREEGPIQRFGWHFLFCLGLSSLFWLLPGTLYYPRFSLTLIIPFCFFAAYGLAVFLRKEAPGLAFIILILFSVISLQSSIAWRWASEPLQDYRGAMREAKAWQRGSGGQIVAGATGAELFEYYSEVPVLVIENREQLSKLRERGPV